MTAATFAIRRRSSLVTLWAATVSFAAGCLPTSTEPGGVTPLEGQWDVAGQTSTGVGTTFSGVLQLQSTSASAFAGLYDVVESVAQGGQRRLSGPVAGRSAGGITVEFDVSLPTGVRRHVGTRAADTVRGSWFDVATTGAVETSGTFRAVRR